MRNSTIVTSVGGEFVMRFLESQIVRLGLLACTLLSVNAASAENSSSVQSRSMADQGLQYSDNSSSPSMPLSSLPSRDDPKNNNGSDNISQDNGTQSEQNPREQRDVNANEPDDSRSIANQLIMNLRGYILTMMSEWEYGADETVPEFMASEQEISEALQKILNRQDASRLKK